METLIERLGEEIEALTKRVLTLVCERDLRLAAAESCTGGLLASIFTDVEGRSHVFDRGFVVYTDQAKHDLLGVSRALLAARGAVSEPVARAMAEGGLARSEADLSLAVTGFAGRAGPDDPPGLVFVALARRDAPTSCRRLDLGDVGRARVRLAALETALKMILAALTG